MKRTTGDGKRSQKATIRAVLLAFGLTVLFVVLFGWAVARIATVFRLLP